MSKVFVGILVSAFLGVIVYSLGAHYFGTAIMPGGEQPSLFAPTLQWLVAAVGAVAIYMAADVVASGVLAIILFVVALVVGGTLQVGWESWLWAAVAAAIGATLGNLFVPVQRGTVSAQ
ncbi:hypothetical protein KJ819_01075 [Patescibacteria group bacterium]|nr:hypothetical protein [Patescibacteria group bacterium]MBU1500429.1 hypothetical protein [Patescibacteria group bacterium]MBU2080497.1 hypothetical protein [Patescibacteria group bacterium]MBU2123698.1 hypothetical protein [Patescibacteria group bacterium]MBU2194554.1 hypothetical protein [Patescibacteria group bacterium]